MARKIGKFEDWTPPWGDDDEKLDVDQVKRLLYNLQVSEQSLLTEKTNLTTSVNDLTAKLEERDRGDETEAQRLARELEETKAKAADPLEIVRLRVALEKGLTLKQAGRLRGANEEELTADADEYLEEVGGKVKPKEGEEGEGEGEEPKPDPSGLRRQPRQVRNPLDRETNSGPELSTAEQVALIPR